MQYMPVRTFKNGMIFEFGQPKVIGKTDCVGHDFTLSHAQGNNVPQESTNSDFLAQESMIFLQRKHPRKLRSPSRCLILDMLLRNKQMKAGIARENAKSCKRFENGSQGRSYPHIRSNLAAFIIPRAHIEPTFLLHPPWFVSRASFWWQFRSPRWTLSLRSFLHQTGRK